MSTVLMTSPVEHQLPLPCKKGPENAVVERDAGFCSGGDEEDLEGEEDSQSPTDVSDESVGTKTHPPDLRQKNKRKCAEPKKFPVEGESTPYKKRRHLTSGSQKTASPIDGETRSPATPLSEDTFISNSRSSPSPFRPWSQHQAQQAYEFSHQQIIRCPSALAPIPSPPILPRPPSLPLQRSHAQYRVLSPSASMTLSTVPPNRIAMPYSHFSNHTIPHRQDNDRVPIIYHHQEEPLSLVLKDDKKSETFNKEHKINGVIKNNNVQHVFKDNVQNRLRFDSVPVYEDKRFVPSNQGVINRDSPILPQVLTRPICETPIKNSLTDIRPKIKVEDSDIPMSSNTGSVRVRTLSEMMSDEKDTAACDLSGSPSRTKFSVESLLGEQRMLASASLDKDYGPSTSRGEPRHKQTSPSALPGVSQRNYKNMTRERRIEANARERTRVHTISAAFDTLRRSIPAYSHNQKLSKLSVLRIACSYILTLSRIAGEDYSKDHSEPSLGECVDLVTRTIQTEGKLRRKKED